MTASHGVSIEAAGMPLSADLTVPEHPAGVVLFAHGSGSSRHSPRNRMVATRLVDEGFATVLADLLTPAEERDDELTGRLRFDIDLLAVRVGGLVDWAVATPPAAGLPLGLFGASTGAGAALACAAQRPAVVRAVVSRGGRPDLAGDALAAVTAPVLLIVGSRDPQVRLLNEQAAARLGGPYRLHIVPGATHLFEEPGALPQVADQAADWFSTHLR